MMDDPNEENIDNNWVIVSDIDVAEEATTLSLNEATDGLEDEYKVTYKDAQNIDGLTRDGNQVEDSKTSLSNEQTRAESDIDSDGISVISESSPLYEDPDRHSLEGNEDGAEKEAIEETLCFLSDMSDKMQSLLEEEEVGTADGASDLLNFYLNCTQKSELQIAEPQPDSGQIVSEEDDSQAAGEVALLEEPEGAVQLIRENLNDSVRSGKFPLGIKKYFNGLLIGTILLAISSIFLGYFVSSQGADDDLPLYQEKHFNDINDLSESLYEEGNYEVPSALTYCRDKHKSDGVYSEKNVEKCLRKIEKRIKRKKDNEEMKENIKNLEDQLKMKEEFLNNKEKYLAKKEYELGIKENLLKHKNKYDKHYQYQSEQAPEIENLKPGEINIKIKDKNRREDFNQKYNKRKYNNENKKNDHKYFNKEKHDKTSSHEKFQKYQSDKDHLKKTKKAKIFNGHDFIDKEAIKDGFKYLPKDKKKFKEKFYSIDPKEKVCKPSKDSKEFRDCDSKKTNCCQAKSIEKHNKNYVLTQKDNNTVSGYWVDKMYKARSELRNKDNSGEWYFDRVSYRKRKRDKAKWYFDWMMDREVMRYKRTYVY